MCTYSSLNSDCFSRKKIATNLRRNYLVKKQKDEDYVLYLDNLTMVQSLII